MSESAAFDLENPKLPGSVRRGAMRSGGYPYDQKMARSDYEDELHATWLQLALLQNHIAATGMRVVLVFEGRDAAGKGGTIRTYLHNLNPRHNINVALPKPSDRERAQWYFQRYVEWLPAEGEAVLFDRSWYNRAGVEAVMGFCTEAETTKFLGEAPQFERMLVNDGIHLIKFWLAIGREMQMERFHKRRHDPLKRWKLSPVDLEALARFDDYSTARDRMMIETHTRHAPWTVVLSNDKRRGRLNVIRSVLHRLDYEGKDDGRIGAIDDRLVFDGPAFVARNAGD